MTLEQAYENGGMLPTGPTLVALDPEECVLAPVGARRRAQPRPLNLGAKHYCIRTDHAGRSCVDGVALL